MGYLQINLCDSWGPGERPDSVHVITSDGVPVFYVPERTCRMVPGRMKYGRRMPKCSECGQSLGDERWVYCPRCGARVVSGDD